MAIEAAALGVGKAVAKLVAGRWLAGRTARAAAGTDLIDLIRTGFPDDIKRRKVQRQFDAMADAVTERLLTFAGQEFGGLDDGDREAVLYQVVLTLDEADLSDEALLAVDTDPVKLARRLRGTVPAQEAEFQLGEAGGRLYDVVLDECCDCLARILVSLPQFQPRALKETLTRLSGLAEQVETALSRLPARSLVAPDGQSEDDDFRRRYLTAISNDLDRLELFGIRFERFTQSRTTLSVAYISLNVSQDGALRPHIPAAIRIDDWRSDERPSAAVRVERALGDHRLILIRGEAGGGKSTLLSWLAITAARGAFTEELAPLNGSVPFVIKLRGHASGALPRPEEFLDDVASNLVGLMPRGWVHRVLLSAEALLLVDGVDEVMSSQRQLVRQWLKALVDQFPGIRIVVTSRPAAADAGWLRAEGFRAAFLEQLGPADLRALVQHWHQAVRLSADLPCPPERLPSFESRLLARLESSPHLRTLAATPLLAAMLCALNLDQNALPRNRMGLYDAVLNMLLVARDVQRNVPTATTTSLEREDKIRILQDVAWHLSTSNRVELPRVAAEKLVANRIIAMPRVRSAALDVFDDLLQRSGVIREPVPGRVDFIHRTIQEYLTAKQAADLGDMDLLVLNAHRDQWRETVVMAAGHANEPLCRELITGIAERALGEPRRARRLKLLAVACLETVTSFPDDVREILDKFLDELIPPRDETTARSLATIGEPLLVRLPDSLRSLSGRAADAAVQSAWLVNGPEALDVLARYASDGLTEYQLSTAWQYFDTDEFAERVLAVMPPGGSLHVRSLAQMVVLQKVPPLAGLRVDMRRANELSIPVTHAESLRHLDLYSQLPGVAMPSLPEMPKLEVLSVHVPSMVDLEFLKLLPRLRTIWLSSCEQIQDYSPLSQFAGLQSLMLDGSENLRSLRQLPSLATIVLLSLEGSQLDPDALGEIANAARDLRNLYLGGCTWVEDLRLLATLKIFNLSVNKCSSLVDISPLATQRDLLHLDISNTRISDLAPLAGLPNLRSLFLNNCAGVADLRPIATLPMLTEVQVAGVAAGADLAPLARNRRLNVHIASGQDVRGAEVLGKHLKVHRQLLSA